MKTEKDISTIIFKIFVAIILSLYVFIILGMLGCVVLSVLLLGIPLLWLVPYYMSVYTNFYLEVKKEYN